SIEHYSTGRGSRRSVDNKADCHRSTGSNRMLPAGSRGNYLGTILSDGGIPSTDKGSAAWYIPASHPGDDRQVTGVCYRYLSLIATRPGVCDCYGRSTCRLW